MIRDKSSSSRFLNRGLPTYSVHVVQRTANNPVLVIPERQETMQFVSGTKQQRSSVPCSLRFQRRKKDRKDKNDKSKIERQRVISRTISLLQKTKREREREK